MQIFGLRRSGGDAAGADQRLVEAEFEAEQVLTENGKTEHDEGEADQPGDRPYRAEGQAKKPDGGGHDAAGCRRCHAGEAGEGFGQPRNRELPGEQDQRADQGDDKGRETRQQQRHTLCARRGQRHSHLNLTHSPSSPKFTEKEPEALGAPRQKAATHANERVLPPCERVIA